MNSRPDLRLDWCSHAAAKYAVEHWHYSRSLPAGKATKIGVWEDAQFVGTVIFARGSNKYLGQPFGLSQLECVELVRVALASHATPTSRIVAVACRMLRKLSPGVRLVISFADARQGHIGTIYQAGGWVYSGTGTDDPRSRPYCGPDGRTRHWRTVAGVLAAKGYPSTSEAAERLGYLPLEKMPKYRYLYPLDDAMRKQIEPLAKPYPKRERGETDSAPQTNAETGGASPTRSLLVPDNLTLEKGHAPNH